MSAFTKDSIIITNSVMASVKLNAKKPSSSVRMILFQMAAHNLKIASLNKRIMRETYVPTSSVHLSVPKPDICVKEVLMNTDARKKMYAF